ncbi:hypothetical protein OOZ19_07535 [Saccharopolyspora sp. NFXS83]|uniref:hypothetical protein n=1 Tax=Saccharopolyspora sp. NFXS83 TaxID=2993560 RepID=UPI00224B3C2D|nr:hypothetical protein [Saccharopolyspora sp. NFXS83]MCX2730088.1 hypothetical protein [Saccharopolyspora sp. NFXS83]
MAEGTDAVGGIRTQLNPGDDTPDDDGGAMQVNTAVLKACGDASADIKDRLDGARKTVEESGAAAGTALSRENFVLGRALSGATETWRSQVDTLVLACAKLDAELHATAEGHEAVEAENEMTMADIAKHFE